MVIRSCHVLTYHNNPIPMSGPAPRNGDISTNVKVYTTMFLEESLASNATQNNSTSNSHDTANVITTTIGGGLSMIGVLLMIVSYFKLEETRKCGTATYILLCISMADFLSAGTSVIGVWFTGKSSTKGCEAEGFLIIFASTASFFWTSCLTVYLFLVMVNVNCSGLASSRKVMFGFHALSLGLPLFLSTLALACGALGPSPSLPASKGYIKLTTGGWCWIKGFQDKSKTVVWTLMTSKFWEIASYVLITILCWSIFCQLRIKFSSSADVGRDTVSAARRVERRMMFIPVAFILLRIWGTVRYFAYVSTLEVRQDILENIPLYAMQGLGDSSQGLANSIFFCLSNKRVWVYWKAAISEPCSFWCYEEDLEFDEHTSLVRHRHIGLQNHVEVDVRDRRTVP